MSDYRCPAGGRFRAVVFDYFGTLTWAVRRGPLHRTMARRLGCDPDGWLDLLCHTFYWRATGRMGEPIEALREMAAALGGDPGFRQLAWVYAMRIAAIGNDGPLRPEAVPVLRALRRGGLRTAVVSDCWYELPLLLPTLPVYPLLDACVYSVEQRRRKPDPAMYLAACARLGVAPDECLYVGDGGSRELTGAAALGMTAVRLAAPDLAGHLTFDPDRDWCGAAVGSLRDVVGLALAPARAALV